MFFVVVDRYVLIFGRHFIATVFSQSFLNQVDQLMGSKHNISPLL